MTHGPTDWVSGERVFGPPVGTLDVDWLVPAVLEGVPAATPAEARDALLAAWSAATEGARPPNYGQPLAPARADGEPTQPGPTAPARADHDQPTPDLHAHATAVVAEAIARYRP